MTLHPVHRVAFLVTTEEKETKNFMAAKLFTAPSDDTKQQHPAKYNYFEERDQLMIGGGQKYMKDDSSVISFYTEALQEVMTKIQRWHAGVEGNIWTRKAKSKIVEFCSL